MHSSFFGEPQLPKLPSGDLSIITVFWVIAQNNSNCGKDHGSEIRTRKVPEKHHVLIIFNLQAIMLRVPDHQHTGDCVQGAIKPGRRTRKGSKLFSFRVFISKRSIRNIAQVYKMPASFRVSLEREPGPCPRLYYCSLTAPPSSLHPLPSLISNHLNLSLRLWKMNESHLLKRRNGRH